MSIGWGYVPMQPPPSEPTAAPEQDNIRVIQLVANRASAPSLGDFLAELHNNELLSDITICSEDGQAIKSHKLVLVRWSAPLRRMLCGDMREAREKDITLHGVDGDVLAAFIRFLYTCHCSIVPEKLVGLCAVADQYDVTLLQQLCMDAIRVHISNHRCCCLFYKAAKDTQQQSIQEMAWQQMSSNLLSLAQRHDVFVQLEFDEVLRLYNAPDVPDAADTQGAGIQPSIHSSCYLEQGLSVIHIAADTAVDVDPSRPWAREDSYTAQPQRATRPEYAMFLAAMAWLRHLPARQQYKQQLYQCFNFDAMHGSELSQVRRHVQADPELKELLLDAFERRCLRHSQQPMYHMGPLLQSTLQPSSSAGEHV